MEFSMNLICNDPKMGKELLNLLINSNYFEDVNGLINSNGDLDIKLKDMILDDDIADTLENILTALFEINEHFNLSKCKLVLANFFETAYSSISLNSYTLNLISKLNIDLDLVSYPCD